MQEREEMRQHKSDPATKKYHNAMKTARKEEQEERNGMQDQE